METRPIKRLKEHDRNEALFEELPSKNEESETLASNSIQDGNQTLANNSIEDKTETLASHSINDENLTLVFDLTIRVLRCPKLLRTCRLVCKEWNESACAVLRSKATTPVTISDEIENGQKYYDKLRRLSDALKSVGSLPTPFRKVSLIVSIRHELYFNVLQRNLGKDLILTELEINGGTNCQQNYFTKNLILLFLRSQSRSLQVLRIHVDTDFEAREESENLVELELPCLKKLHIEFRSELNFCCPSYYKVLIRDIVLHSKLQLLRLQYYKLNQLTEVLGEINLDSVATLQVEAKGLTDFKPGELPVLIQMLEVKPWHNLKRLNILLNSGQEVVNIVSKTKASLELLGTKHVKIPLDLLPVCPRLVEMHCDFGYNGQILPEKFPSLKKFYNYKCLDSCLDFANIVPHYGVVQASVGVKHMTFFQHASSRFCPFCSKWKSWMQEFSEMKMYSDQHQAIFCNVSTALRTMQKTFPNLKTLSTHSDFYQITTIVPTSCELRRQKDFLKLPFDLFIKEIFPFEEFLELETLALHGIKVNPELIISSLSKIPKLKYLKFQEYENLTAKIIRDYLGHLKEIAMEHCSADEFQRSRNYKLNQDERKLMKKIKRPLIKFYCNCLDCKNPLCYCQDCHQYDQPCVSY